MVTQAVLLVNLKGVPTWHSFLGVRILDSAYEMVYQCQVTGHTRRWGLLEPRFTDLSNYSILDN